MTEKRDDDGDIELPQDTLDLVNDLVPLFRELKASVVSVNGPPKLIHGI